MAKSRVTDITIDYSNPVEQSKAQAPLSPAKAEVNWGELYSQPALGDLPTLVQASRRRRHLAYVAAALVFLLIGAGVSWFLFGRSPAKFGEEAVQFNLQTSPEIPSGQVIEYTLAYNNNQSVGLKQIEINFRYPDGFTFSDANLQPDNKEATNFIISNIDSYQSGSLIVRGQLIGELKDNKQLTALIAYEPANIKAQFTKTLMVSTQLVASVVNLELQGPDKLAISQPATLAIKYRNSSTAKLVNLRLRLNLPGGFELEVPALAPEAGQNNIWKLPDLEPQSEGSFELKGKFSPAAQGVQQSVGVAVGFLGGVDRLFSVQEEKIWQVALATSQISLNLTANDVALKSQIDLGQEVKYELVLANDGDTPYSDMAVKIKLSTQYLDWSSLKDDFGGKADSNVGTINWSADGLSLLKLLQPKSRITLSFRIRTVGGLVAEARSPVSLAAQATAEVKQLVDNNLQTVSVQSNEVVTKLNSVLSLSAEGRYYTDQLIKLGSGPLPPRVGQTTTYVIFWRLGNTLNDLENIEVTTTLPQDVNWTGQTAVSAGQGLTYNPNTREVRWQLNRLPAGAGLSFAKPEAWFEVAIRPVESDADKILVLTKTTTATARDSVSGADLIATAKFVTTELDDDLSAQGKGAVVR